MWTNCGPACADAHSEITVSFACYASARAQEKGTFNDDLGVPATSCSSDGTQCPPPRKTAHRLWDHTTLGDIDRNMHKKGDQKQLCVAPQTMTQLPQTMTQPPSPP